MREFTYGLVWRTRGRGTGDALATLNAPSIDRFEFANGSVLTYAQLLARGFDLDGGVGDDVIVGTNVSDRVDFHTLRTNPPRDPSNDSFFTRRAAA